MKRIEDNCDVIRDLLPSYVDELCSEATKDVVEAHLNTCKECEEVCSHMKEDAYLWESKEVDLEALDGLKRVRRNRMIQFALLLAIVFVVSCVFGVPQMIGTSVISGCVCMVVILLLSVCIFLLLESVYKEIKERKAEGKKRNMWILTRKLAASLVAVACVIGGGSIWNQNQWITSMDVAESAAAPIVSEDKKGSAPVAEEAAEEVATEEENDGVFGAGIPSKQAVGEDYQVASGYEAVYERLEKIEAAKGNWMIGNELFAVGEAMTGGVAADGAMAQDSVASAPAADMGAAKEEAESVSGPMHSTTNLMTEGVDESDIVKTDGDYIYRVNGGKVLISDIRNGEATEVASVIPDGSSASDLIKELYIDKDQMIVLVDHYEYGNSDVIPLGQMEKRMAVEDVISFKQATGTQAYIYDISNPEAPKQTDRIDMDGSYYTSRKVGDNLYLFAMNQMEMPELDKKEALEESNIHTWIPSINGEPVAAECIYLPREGNRYLLMASIDLTNPDKAKDAKMIVCNYPRIYVGASKICLYEEDYSSDSVVTKLSVFNYEDGVIQVNGATALRGSIQDSFAINEYEKHLRVLTTDWSAGASGNNLFILKEDLSLCGRIDGVAPGEQIYSARFMGDTGYFVTFRNVDPLFTVDLSNPSNPQIVGELKVTGFSDYLHFWGEEHLLGIGFEANEDGQTQGIKLSMFNISDPANVYEEHKEVLKDVDYSSALYEYKAVLADAGANMIGFVGTNYDEAEPLSYYLYSYDENGFHKTLEENLNGWNDSGYRGLYARDYFYIVNSEKIVSIENQ